MRVLVIDDEPAVGRILAEALTHQGHAAGFAGSGLEALAFIHARRPDVVFLDLAMPGLSGVEVLREIRRRDARLPVVVLTGRAEPEQLAELRELGIVDVVEKPWALKSLAAMMDAVARPGLRAR
jgi:DNA-binding response OmpR family regulator